ncbi:polysaccharide lyase family 8 super-sandwich domain-containing protein [Paenibacillus sp. Soil766]|uniref:polysaccharide lyase family 8 super-sandwich domain-containing protein n=1 Tax=Paenibacillus sp. Soil766 TaxID=1736404 RepID=UPI001F38E9AA|nr:polysaccharide lyase family 8 super-sandwich domain-containing protein [Paenibacillus sp. Soil766]
MKKWMASLLVFVIFFSLWISPGLGGLPPALGAATVHVSVNYDESATAKNTKIYNGTTYTGTIGGAWGTYNSAANTDYVMMAQAPLRDDYSLKMTSNTTNLNTGRNNLGGAVAGNSGISGNLVFEASVYMNSTQHRRDIQFRSLNAPVPASATTNVSVLSFDNTGKIKDANNTALANYEANTWYRLKLFVDNTARKVSYFANDQFLGEASLPAAWLNIRHIYLYQYYKSGVQGEFYVDDLKLADYVPVSGLTTSLNALELSETTHSTITATTLPADASDQRFVWEVDDPTVATVTYGLISALKEGNTTVTVSTYGGAFTKTIPIAVVKPVPLTNITLPNQSSLVAGKTLPLQVVFQPDNATNKKLNWQSSDSSVATVDTNGVVTGIAAGNATITATSQLNAGLTSHTSVTVTPFIPLVSVSFTNAPLQMTNYDTFQLETDVVPANATDKLLTWQSNNSSIIRVDENGLVSALKVGTAIITVTSSNGKQASATIDVKAPVLKDPQEYDKLRIRWKETITGKDTLDVTNNEIKRRIDDNAAKAQLYWDSLQMDSGSTTLWTDLVPSASDSTFVLDHYTRLKTMAQAYATKGTLLSNNPELKVDILQAMDWMLDHLYTNSGVEFGNWWNWDIGIPTRLADILILLYDDLTPEQIARNTASIDHYIGDVSLPTFTQVGANRSDIMLIETRMGLVEKNYDRLIQARDGLTPLFDYVTTGDGFYEDGSFIQHSKVAYTGSYGEVLISGMGNLLLLLNGSTWQPVVPEVEHVYRWIREGYAPVMYKGQILDMTRGRAIVREGLDAYGSAKNILLGMSRIAQTASAERAAYLKSFIKYHFQFLLARGLTYSQLPLDLADTIKEWIENPAIQPIAELPEHFEMNAMARSIHVGNGYLFGVSKSSKRIVTYELTNGENAKGWYTGDGMTYLYNNDVAQYTDNYWATLNWYRLPGTTVVVRPRTSDQYQYGDGESSPANAWAGGAVLGKYGVTGMNLIQNGTQMKANKSWFTFDNEIIALGSDITSTDNKTVETIVEQRKLTGNNTNDLYVNGEQKNGYFGEETVEHPEWFHLQGNVAGADMGYVFPGTQSLKLMRAEQEGRYSDTSLSNPPEATVPTEPLQNNYLTMWFDHGSNPTNASYQYAILPNASKTETSAYASSPDYTVLANSQDVQAVRENKLGMTVFNFWKDKVTSVDGLTSNSQASVMLKGNRHTGVYEIAVADPTLENNGFIDIELDKPVQHVISKDDRIEIQQLSPKLKFKVNVQDTMGKSQHVSLQLVPEPEEETGSGTTDPEPTMPGATNPEPTEKPDSVNVKEDKATVEMGHDKDTVSVPIEQIPNVPLEVQGVTAQITVQPEVVQALRDKVVGNGSQTTLEIMARPVLEPSILQAGASDPTVRVNLASQVIEFALSMRSEDGDTWSADMFQSGVEIVLPFDPASKDPELLGVYRYNKASGNWEYVGGTINVLANQAIFSPEQPGIYAVLAYDKKFDDMPESHWASRAVQVLSAKHIIEGMTSSDFKPNGKTTRAQFTALLVRALHVEKQATWTSEFDDIQEDDWYAQDVAAARRAGLVAGVTDQTFDPNAAMTREQMAILVVRAYEYLNGSYTLIHRKLDDYTDQSDISTWALEGVNKAIELGILSGISNERFSPSSTALRMETAEALYKFLKKKIGGG